MYQNKKIKINGGSNMGLDFSKPAMTNVTATAGQTDKNEIAVVEQYDIVADRQQMNQE